MTLEKGNEAFHISRTVLADIIRVFLVGLPWETVDMGDMIMDSVANEAWCRWREVQELRPMIINQFKRSGATRALAIDMERMFNRIKEGTTSIDLDKIVSKHFIFFIDEESPAFGALRRMARTPYKAGRIFPVSKEELESLRKDLLVVQVKEND